MTTSPASLAQDAQKAMQEGRYDDAHLLLAKLHELAPEDATVILMQAYTYRAQGQVPEARDAFERAIALDPGNLTTRGPYAIWLSDLGDFDAAVAQYDMMLSYQPNIPDAKVDRLLALSRTAARAEALADLARFVAANPGHVRAGNNLALLLRDDDRIQEAEDTVRFVLQNNPDNGRAAHFLAICQREAGKPAIAAFSRAAALSPETLSIQSALAQAEVDEGRAENGIALLERAVEQNPEWLEGLHSLAELKRQYVGPAGFASHYETAVGHGSDNPALWATYATLIGRVEGHEAELEIIERADAALGSAEPMQLARANCLSELGRYGEAEQAFALLDPRGDTEQANGYLRFLTRSLQFEEARTVGMALAEEGRADGDTWPYIAIALRKLNDPRWEWLEGDERFVRTFDLDGFAARLPELRETLQKLHVFNHQPIAQSVRGGTQTANILFRNQAPVIQALVAELQNCVREYVDGLPAFDAAHPLLRLPREGFRFSGSWSVRLSGGGFHASHVHTHGDISSAFYVTLPEDMGENGGSAGEGVIEAGAEAGAEAGGADPKAGWLTLGEPAAELGTGLGAIRTVKPVPARLALFPSTMWHGTRPFQAGERVTCAFDVQLKPYR